MVLSLRKQISKGYVNMNLTWGPGVPQFMPTDIMNEDEIREYGVVAAINFCKKNDFVIINAQAAKNVWPNIVAQKDNLLWFIAVATAIYPEYGKFEQDEKDNLIEHANKFGALAVVMNISIGSADAERCSESLALRDDEFRVSIAPMEFLNK